MRDESIEQRTFVDKANVGRSQTTPFLYIVHSTSIVVDI